MSNYNPKYHKRRSIRLKDYDYSQAGRYFITLCVQNRTCLFGNIESGQMQLNHFGAIIKEEWEKTPEIRKNITLGEYIIMPNHFHCIIQIDYPIKTKEKQQGKFRSPSHTIGAIIRGFKGATTKKIKEIIRNSLTGELEKIPPRTGKSLFAPTTKLAPTESPNKGESEKFPPRTGELLFAPTKSPQTDESLFAPTIDLSKSIWQRNYWEHIIRNENAFRRITQYIINNPQKWEDDKLNGGKGNTIKEQSIPYGEENWMI